MKLFLVLLALCLGVAHVYASTQSASEQTIVLPEEDDDEIEDTEGDE
jgi:hypothetical protein